MTVNQNRIQMPQHRQVRVVITLDPNTAQTEVRIEQGKLTHVQLLGLLMEHATALLKNMMSMGQKPTVTDVLEGGNNAS